MRMRRKKHREERLEACADILIADILKYKNDIGAVFDDDKPLRMEIGCGKGKFITETAIINPDINFIAFEKNLDVLVLAAEKIKDAGLSNVRLVAADANILAEFDTKSKCEVIYINFCDPWPKNGYRKRRLTHANYLALWKKLLCDSGEIHFKTDNKGLFEFSLNSFSDYGMRLKNITLDLHASDFEGNVMTEYEMLFSEKGNPIYRTEAIFLK
ncbi:MAG: tRNA (guanosine(46)-N7)-methyltransferase TrmB [Candidatus Fimenecus sp.]|nr:tRNA (guanosine(46)-N7)-methyltransferase TrmB [Candidatus Fimenecus sp.]